MWQKYFAVFCLSFLCAGSVFPAAYAASTAPAPAAGTNRAQILRGTVTAVGACTNLNAIFFTTSNNPDKVYVFQSGIPSIPLRATPTIGQNVFATVGQSIRCARIGTTSLEAWAITYFNAFQTSSPQSPPASAGGSSSGNQAGGPNSSGMPSGNTGSASSGRGSSSQGGGVASSIAREAASAGVRELTSSLSSAVSGLLSGGFGGTILSQPIICTNGATLFYIGATPYIYQAGVSRSYLSGPPTHIGQKILGRALPYGSGHCFYGPYDYPGSLILFHGSSI